MDAIALIIGRIVMAATGFCAAALLLLVAVECAFKYGWRLWDNLAAVYRLESIKYWFRRMHDNGTHILRKEHDEKLAAAMTNKDGGND